MDSTSTLLGSLEGCDDAQDAEDEEEDDADGDYGGGGLVSWHGDVVRFGDGVEVFVGDVFMLMVMLMLMRCAVVVACSMVMACSVVMVGEFVRVLDGQMGLLEVGQAVVFAEGHGDCFVAGDVAAFVGVFVVGVMVDSVVSAVVMRVVMGMSLKRVNGFASVADCAVAGLSLERIVVVVLVVGMMMSSMMLIVVMIFVMSLVVMTLVAMPMSLMFVNMLASMSHRAVSRMSMKRILVVILVMSGCMLLAIYMVRSLVVRGLGIGKVIVLIDVIPSLVRMWLLMLVHVMMSVDLLVMAGVVRAIVMSMSLVVMSMSLLVMLTLNMVRRLMMLMIMMLVSKRHHPRKPMMIAIIMSRKITMLDDTMKCRSMLAAMALIMLRVSHPLSRDTKTARCGDIPAWSLDLHLGGNILL